MPPRTLPNWIGFQVDELRRQGMPWRDIAKELGISDYGARMVRERALKQERESGDMSKRLSSQDIKDLMRMKEQGLSQTDIAKILGITQGAVSRMYVKMTDPQKYAEMMEKNRQGIEARKEAKKAAGIGNKADMFEIEYSGADWSRAHKAVFGTSVVMKELANV